MVQDGLLSLDEACADTLTEWRDDPLKRVATIRSLLSLSSGVGGGQHAAEALRSAGQFMGVAGA